MPLPLRRRQRAGRGQRPGRDGGRGGPAGTGRGGRLAALRRVGRAVLGRQRARVPGRPAGDIVVVPAVGQPRRPAGQRARPDPGRARGPVLHRSPDDPVRRPVRHLFRFLPVPGPGGARLHPVPGARPGRLGRAGRPGPAARRPGRAAGRDGRRGAHRDHGDPGAQLGGRRDRDRGRRRAGRRGPGGLRRRRGPAVPRPVSGPADAAADRAAGSLLVRAPGAGRSPRAHPGAGPAQRDLLSGLPGRVHRHLPARAAPRRPDHLPGLLGHGGPVGRAGRATRTCPCW